MPFDDAAEAKCADSESEDEYVESRLERVLREEASEAKPEAPRYTQLDDELLSDMQRGDEQMRRLVRHRLNKQREAADEKVCRQLLRKERFERGMRKGCIDHDEKLAALAQREEVEEVRAEAKQREDDEREARRLEKVLRDEAYAEYVEERLRDQEARAAQAADAKGARAAKEMAAWLEQEASARKAGADAGPRLGWVPGAEKLNGRWVMMGFLIGLITEYSTGVNFIDQVLLALTNMGVLDLEV